MTREDQRFNATLRVAMQIAEQPYRRAIAAQLEGDDDGEHWIEFERILRRAFVLAELHGMADMYAAAVRAGGRFDFTDQAPRVPDTFARSVDLSDFEVGPFREAIDEFATRVPMLRAEAERVMARSRVVAEEIARLERAGALADLAAKSTAIQAALDRPFFVSDVSRETTDQLRQLVAGAIRGDSIGVSEFIDKAQAAGAQNLTRARLQTVYRNNLSTAFNEGRMAALSHPETARTMPLMMLVEIRDRRTRGNPGGLYPQAGPHYQMHGYVNTRAEFERMGIVPPNGHNCRGGMRAITAAESRRMGLLNEDGSVNQDALARHNGNRQQLIDNGQYPDPGWSNR